MTQTSDFLNDARVRQTFGRLAERSVARERAAQQLQTILMDFPELFHDLLAAYGETSENAQPQLFGPSAQAGRVENLPEPVDAGSRKTTFTRIIEVFLKNGNGWINTADLTVRSGVSRNVLATLLWSTHRLEFEQRPHPTHKRMKEWRLTALTYDHARVASQLMDNRKELE